MSQSLICYHRGDIMNFLAFSTYLYERKRTFQPLRYESDIHYRSVLFHQFGESYRYYCRMHQLVHEYDTIAYGVRQYEQRVETYRNA